MLELSRYLFLAGALPFLVLGIAHVFATPLGVGQARGLSPSDADLEGAMSRSGLRLTRRTDVWRCWIGFNLSHGFGVVFFALTVLLVGRSPETFRAQAPVFAPLAVAMSSALLVLGLRYWFRTPIIGCAMGVALFVSSWMLVLGWR
jgi:hypothetical protein